MKRLEEKQDCGEEQRLSAEQPHYLQRHPAKTLPWHPNVHVCTGDADLPASANLVEPRAVSRVNFSLWTDVHGSRPPCAAYRQSESDS